MFTVYHLPVGCQTWIRYGSCFEYRDVRQLVFDCGRQYPDHRVEWWGPKSHPAKYATA